MILYLKYNLLSLNHSLAIKKRMSNFKYPVTITRWRFCRYTAFLYITLFTPVKMYICLFVCSLLTGAASGCRYKFGGEVSLSY